LKPLALIISNNILNYNLFSWFCCSFFLISYSNLHNLWISKPPPPNLFEYLASIYNAYISWYLELANYIFSFKLLSICLDSVWSLFTSSSKSLNLLS
jgi:hypothetical protein